jgi:hypothetical protein
VRIRDFERRRLCGVVNTAEQTCFVGSMATAQLHFDDGTWPSGKAPGFGPGIRRFESYRPSQFDYDCLLTHISRIISLITSFRETGNEY